MEGQQQRVGNRIDDPRMSDSFASIHAGFSDTIDARGGWRKDLADPIGRQGKVGSVGNRGQAFAAPFTKIWNDDVLPEVDFGSRCSADSGLVPRSLARTPKGALTSLLPGLVGRMGLIRRPRRDFSSHAL